MFAFPNLTEKKFSLRIRIYACCNVLVYKEESSIPENSSEQNDVPVEKQLEATTNQTEKIENNEVKDRSSKVSTRVRERRRRQGR